MLGTGRTRTLPFHALQNVHQFRDLTPLFGAIARGDGMLGAMPHVVAQDFFLGAAQRSAHRGNLRDNIDAIPVLFDHPGKTAHLAFDPIESLKTGILDVLAHNDYYIPLPGTGYK